MLRVSRTCSSTLAQYQKLIDSYNVPRASIAKKIHVIQKNGERRGSDERILGLLVWAKEEDLLLERIGIQDPVVHYFNATTLIQSG